MGSEREEGVRSIHDGSLPRGGCPEMLGNLYLGGARRTSAGRGGVADGTRTRNNQNHNLGIYH